MHFKKVEFDTDLDDMEAGELRELVREFEQAQEQNITDFAEVEGEITEFEEFDSELTSDLVEQTSLSEEAASALPFSEKRELLADLNATEEKTQEEQEFEDRGKKGETSGEDEEVTPDFVKDTLDGVAGVQP
jgi:hypothetical protein